MYEIEYSEKAKKFIKKSDKDVVERILKGIEKLKENPIPSDTKFIGRDNGEMVFRYRIGKFRALYKVKEIQKTLLVTKIDKRNKVYD